MWCAYATIQNDSKWFDDMTVIHNEFESIREFRPVHAVHVATFLCWHYIMIRSWHSRHQVLASKIIMRRCIYVSIDFAGFHITERNTISRSYHCYRSLHPTTQHTHTIEVFMSKLCLDTRSVCPSPPPSPVHVHCIACVICIYSIFGVVNVRLRDAINKLMFWQVKGLLSHIQLIKHMKGCIIYVRV